jgi:hypothetical protein
VSQWNVVLGVAWVGIRCPPINRSGMHWDLV